MQHALQEVARLAKEYGSINIEELEWKMQRKLELELDKHSVVFKQHKTDVNKQIVTVNEQLEVCLQLKDSCVETRLEKHHIIE